MYIDIKCMKNNRNINCKSKTIVLYKVYFMLDIMSLNDKMSGFPVRDFYYFLSTLAVISPRPLEAHINAVLSSGSMAVGPNSCFHSRSY